MSTPKRIRSWYSVKKSRSVGLASELVNPDRKIDWGIGISVEEATDVVQVLRIVRDVSEKKLCTWVSLQKPIALLK
jgi:hypothetical protein